jgi:hypothetical protein
MVPVESKNILQETTWAVALLGLDACVTKAQYFYCASWINSQALDTLICYQGNLQHSLPLMQG